MDVHSMHTIFIALHAISGVISLLAGGLLILSPRRLTNLWLFRLYAWFLIGLVVFLAGAMLVPGLNIRRPGESSFPGLFGLGLYMLYRARSAHKLLGIRQGNWKQTYIEHIGFTLISLLEGFIIVTVLNSGGPGWLVALLAIFGVVLGRWAIGSAQQRVEMAQIGLVGRRS